MAREGTEANTLRKSISQTRTRAEARAKYDEARAKYEALDKQIKEKQAEGMTKKELRNLAIQRQVYLSISQEANKRASLLGRAEARGVSAESLQSFERTSEARERSRQARLRRSRPQETTVTASVETAKLSGRGSGKRGDTRTEVVAPGVELGFSERTGRSFLIREGGTGINAAALAAAQSGSLDAVDTSSQGRFYQAATGTARREAGFQYQPPVNRFGQQANDQPSPVNFPAFQAAAQTGGEVQVPIEQRAGGGTNRLGMNIVTTSDVARFERRVGSAIVPYSATRDTANPAQIIADTTSRITRTEPQVVEQTGSQRFVQQFGAGVNTQLRERPLSTAALTGIGFGVGAGASAIASTGRVGYYGVQAATLGAGTYYVGSVGATAVFSGNPGRVLGQEAPKAIAFGTGYYYGAGLTRVAGARTRTGATDLSPENILAMNRRGGLTGRETVGLSSTYSAQSVLFRAGSGRPIIPFRQRLRGLYQRAGETTLGQGLKSLGRSRRGTGQILQQPRSRSRNPAERIQDPFTRRVSRERTAGVVGRGFRSGFRSRISRVNQFRSPSSISRFRTGAFPISDVGFNQGFTPITNQGLGSGLGFKFGTAAIGAGLLGLGLFSRGGGQRTGGASLGSGGGLFGSPGLFGRGFRSQGQYTPSWAALELGITASGRSPRGRRYSGFELRPVFTGGGI